VKASEITQTILDFLSDAVDKGGASAQAAFAAAVDQLRPAYALIAPNGQETRGNWATLPTTQEQTNDIAFKFESPIEVVGFVPVITPAVWDQFNVAAVGPLPHYPKLDDFLVQYSVDNEYYPTEASEGATLNTSNVPIANFCDALALSMTLPRLNAMLLKSDRPELRFKFRSKYVTAPNVSGIPFAVICGINIVFKRLPRMPG
jgi:hypothetical protein